MPPPQAPAINTKAMKDSCFIPRVFQKLEINANETQVVLERSIGRSLERRPRYLVRRRPSGHATAEAQQAIQSGGIVWNFHLRTERSASQVQSRRSKPIRPCCTTAANRHTAGVHSLPGDGRGHLARCHRPREVGTQNAPLISTMTTPPSGCL